MKISMTTIVFFCALQWVACAQGFQDIKDPTTGFSSEIEFEVLERQVKKNSDELLILKTNVEKLSDKLENQSKVTHRAANGDANFKPTENSGTNLISQTALPQASTAAFVQFPNMNCCPIRGRCKIPINRNLYGPERIVAINGVPIANSVGTSIESVPELTQGRQVGQPARNFLRSFKRCEIVNGVRICN